jgi:hypothetical protein
MIPVYENYQGYQPPPHVNLTICRLLRGVPEGYLSGLRSVVLTNGSAVGKGKTMRVAGRKHARRDCLGFYHPERRGEPPWIEIVVDNIVAGKLSGPLRFVAHVPLFRDLTFADVLYHEVGHHLDHTIGAPAPSGEAAAEAWAKRLKRHYVRKRYWYLRPLRPFARALDAILSRLIAFAKARAKAAE